MGAVPVSCGWCHPWAGGPEFYKKAGRASHVKQGSKKHSSMASGSVPASRFLPCLYSCPDFLWWWTAVSKCKPNKPFSPQPAFCSQCFVSAIETLRYYVLRIFLFVCVCIYIYIYIYIHIYILHRVVAIVYWTTCLWIHGYTWLVIPNLYAVIKTW